MCRMYKLILLVVMLIMTPGNIWSQQSLDPPIDAILYAARYLNNGAAEYTLASIYQIGRKDGTADPFNPNTTEDTYRSIFVFNISQIPTNAEIQTATLDASISGYQCSYCIAEFVGISNPIDPVNAQQIWQEVGASSNVYLSINYDEQVTNVSSTSLKNDISATLGNSTFFKIGVLSAAEAQNNSEAQTVFLTLHVTYTVPGSGNEFNITVKNSYDGGNLKVDGNTVASGTTFTWQANSQHTLEAFDQDWPATNNYFRVFQKWNGPEVSGNTNKTITITVTQDALYEAVSLRRFDFVVTTDFIEGGSIGSLKVDGSPVSDPYSSTIIETNSRTVEVLPVTKIVNGKSINYNFSAWSDGGTANPRTFVPNDHTNITAVYKGHLATLASGATAFNNQRKMVYDGSTYHLVYESDGEIWYTASSDNGVTWANEVRLSDGDGGNKYPSVDIADGSIIPVVVWQQDLPSSQTILMRRKVSGSWQNTEIVKIFIGAPTGFQATPVVVAQGSYDFFVWNNDESGIDNLRIRSYNTGNGSLGTETTIPGTNSSSLYPSLAADRFTKLYLAWAESGKIYYTKINHSNGGNYTFSPNKEEVSQLSGYSNHVFPSISVDYNLQPQVMWQAYSGPALESQIILHRWRSSGSGGRAWGGITSFIGNDDYEKPSIMSYPVINNQKRRGTWARGGSLIWAAKYDGSTWSDFYQGATGVDPNISANPTGTEAVKEVYRGSGGAPFSIATTSNNLLKTTGENLVRRRGVIGYGNSEIVFEAGEFAVAGNPVKLITYPDTLVVGQSGKWEEMFRTEPVMVSDGDILSYFQGFETLNPDELTQTLPGNAKIRFLLEVVDAAKNKTLATLDEQKITPNHLPADTRVRKEFVLTVNTRTEVFFRVQVRLTGDLSISQSMVEAHYETGVDSLARSVSDQPVPVALTPKTFALSQNYPNPFNPETVINFQLPINSHVELSIYNTLGQKVRTLVNGSLPAGRHEIVWNGRNAAGTSVSSGVYLYRMTAEGFTQTRKMMLMR